MKMIINNMINNNQSINKIYFQNSILKVYNNLNIVVNYIKIIEKMITYYKNINSNNYKNNISKNKIQEINIIIINPKKIHSTHQRKQT